MPWSLCKGKQWQTSSEHRWSCSGAFMFQAPPAVSPSPTQRSLFPTYFSPFLTFLLERARERISLTVSLITWSHCCGPAATSDNSPCAHQMGTSNKHCGTTAMGGCDGQYCSTPPAAADWDRPAQWSSCHLESCFWVVLLPGWNVRMFPIDPSCKGCSQSSICLVVLPDSLWNDFSRNRWVCKLRVRRAYFQANIIQIL